LRFSPRRATPSAGIDVGQAVGLFRVTAGVAAIVDVSMDGPRIFEPINVQNCEPGRPTTLVSGGPGRRRLEFMRLPDESIDELDDATRAWELLEPWDVTPDTPRSNVIRSTGSDRSGPDRTRSAALRRRASSPVISSWSETLASG